MSPWLRAQLVDFRNASQASEDSAIVIERHSDLPETFALTGGTIFTGDDFTVEADAHVVIERGRIATVATGTAPSDVPAVDVSGCVVIPGLINAHTHIVDSAVKELSFGLPSGTNLFFPPHGVRPRALGMLSRDVILDGIRGAARHMLSTGTVAFADFASDGIDGVRLIHEAIHGLPLHAVILGGLDQSFHFSDDALAMNEQPLDAGQLRALDELLAVADGIAPVRAFDLTDAALRQVSHLAAAQGKLVSTHLAAAPYYRESSLRFAGKPDIERAIAHLNPHFGVHLTTATEAEIQALAAEQIGVVICASANAALGGSVPPFTLASEAGSPVGLGTDNLMINSPDLFAEMSYLGRAVRSSAHDPSAADPLSIVKAATLGGAQALRLDRDLGSIAAGKLASMVILDFTTDNLAGSTNPMASIVNRASSRDIRAVLIEGRVVHGALASRQHFSTS